MWKSHSARVARLVALGAVCGLAFATNGWAATMEQVLQQNPQLKDFYNTVQLAGLGNNLEHAPPFTAFVPVNTGYDRLPSNIRSALLTGAKGSSAMKDKHAAQYFIRSHAVRGVHPLSDFEGKVTRVESITGYQFTVDGTVPGKLTINATTPDELEGVLGALPAKPRKPINVILPPIETDNGIVYPIDGVLK